MAVELGDKIAQIGTGIYRLVMGKDVDIAGGGNTEIDAVNDEDIILIDDAAAGTQASTKYSTFTKIWTWVLGKLGGTNVSVLVDDGTYLTAHPNITAAASVDNSGKTYIQDITLDGNGHVTALTSATDVDTTLTTEQVEDIVGEMVNGSLQTNIAVTYDDANGKIDFAATMDTDTQLSDEEVQDIAGALVATGGTKTGIAVTYQDATGDMDFVVDHDAATNFVAEEHYRWDNDIQSTATINHLNLSSDTPGEAEVLVMNDGDAVWGHPEKIHLQVRNDEGATIPAGAPLYSRGEIGGSNRILVGVCDANDSAKMPCIGIAEAEMNTSSTKDNFAITQGVYNTNISGFTGLAVGDTLYVDTSGSAPHLTKTKPTGESSLIQNVGIVLKTNGSTCQGLQVSAIGRTNDVPNLNSGYVFYGNGSNQAVSTQLSTLLPPDLTVDGAGTVHANNYTNTTYSIQDGELSQNNFTDADHTKLNNIEANATADQTAAEILALMLTVDGTGSGLDADTLDGIDSSGFATSSHSHNLNDLSDVDTTGVANGDLIKYNGSSWEDFTPPYLEAAGANSANDIPFFDANGDLDVAMIGLFNFDPTNFVLTTPSLSSDSIYDSSFTNKWLESTSLGDVIRIGQSNHITGNFLKWDGSKAVWDAVPSSGGVGGTNTQVQYNDGGTLNGTPLITIDDVNNKVIFTGDVHINGSNENIELNSGADIVLEASTNGGSGSSSIQYPDSGGSKRMMLAVHSNNRVTLCNRAANGTVEVRANNATGGSGGEKVVATFKHDGIVIEDNGLIPSSTTNTLYNTSGQLSFDGDLIPRVKKTNLSISQYQNLGTTGIVIVPAPGASNHIVIDNVFIRARNGSAAETRVETLYVGHVAGHTGYNFGSHKDFLRAMPSSTTWMRQVMNNNEDLNNATTSNLPVYIYSSGNYTGDVTLNVVVTYSIIRL